jgi:hypothetical protein
MVVAAYFAPSAVAGAKKPTTIWSCAARLVVASYKTGAQKAVSFNLPVGLCA